MPLGLAYGSSSRRSRLRRRSSTGSMPIWRAAMSSSTSRASDSNCHGPAVRGAPDGVRVDRLGREAGARARGTGPGNSMPTAAAGPTGHGVGYAPQSDTKSMWAAWIAPSASNAIVTSACSWRDLPAASRFSRRSSTHFTGAPTFGAASIRHISSRCTMIFCPKPPPVSRMITRMRCSGMPEQAGAEQAHLVRRLRRRVDRELAGRAATSRRPGRAPPSAPARTPAGRSSRVTTCAADANTSSSAAAGRPASSADDVGAVALVHERVGVLGRRVVDDRRERLVVDVDQLGRVLGEVAALGDHERDRVADEADLALGQRRARRLRAPRADRRVPLLLHAPG